MLNINHLIVKRGQQHVLTIDELTVNDGEFIAIIGPNGAGKSSLLKTLASQWSPHAGDIELNGQSLNDWTRKNRAQHIAVLPQSSDLVFSFKAKEVVEIGATPLQLDRQSKSERIQFWMLQTDTWHLADRIYTSLSGGERQRVQLARVLLQISSATSPALLLLDEPTSAQDLGQQHRILQLLRQLCAEKNIIVVTILHDLNLASRYSDKICLLHQGKLFAAGPPADILTPSKVNDVWGYEPEKLTNMDGATILI